ncbi:MULTISPECIES: hypothetical protein [Deinococcus]|uniref:MarR family transcriptional regulator n=1 Tax=Deinococcus rufus TaxID=2136097 RepID=A0ABV7Z5C7_9DEIO|nr:hypothetical protein [Deinococcus sp. AB2017081]WQE95125.1 hypothetical protein U2P90_17330 [Deinococcus sp. AB2017081]
MTLHDPRRITDPHAARALRQHHAFLGLFVQPQSPSSVAGSAGMAANLAHHHARKLAALGLLHEQRRGEGARPAHGAGVPGAQHPDPATGQ